MAGRPKSDSDSEPKVPSQAPGIHKSVAEDIYLQPKTDASSLRLPLQGIQLSSQSLNITISYITNIYTNLDPNLDPNCCADQTQIPAICILFYTNDK